MILGIIKWIHKTIIKTDNPPVNINIPFIKIAVVILQEIDFILVSIIATKKMPEKRLVPIPDWSANLNVFLLIDIDLFWHVLPFIFHLQILQHFFECRPALLACSRQVLIIMQQTYHLIQSDQAFNLNEAGMLHSPLFIFPLEVNWMILFHWIAFP